MPSISVFCQFLRQHPHYLGRFIEDICHVWVWHLKGQPVVVLTTESGGLGDYLWFRSYYSAIREHYAWRQCRIIVIGMRQWEPWALEMDGNPRTNHFDIYRSFESPDHSLKIERLFFQLFRADVYVNFRARHLKQVVKAKEYYFGKGFRDSKQYYETVNNSLINKWFALPSTFQHKPPFCPIVDSRREEALSKPFVVVVEGGNTQGKLSKVQTATIIETLLSKGYNVFFNGNYRDFIAENKSVVAKYQQDIIDGYTYPLKEYPAVVSNSLFVVTVNTLIYHLAVQLEKPCVVMSANEYESIKLDQPNQVVVFNRELQQAYENETLQAYLSDPSVGLQNIETERIVEAIDIIAEICYSPS